MNLQGNYIGYLGAFLGGVVVSFSPCVYPLIPVTLAFIGAKAAQSRLKGLILSLIYVFGISVTYSALGLFASLSGRLFGQISTHPVSYFILANTCIIAGLSFLDVININFRGLNLKDKVKASQGFFSVFLFGVISGLVVGPCTAPALGTILVYVATSQNIIYGASLLFVFAFGMGFTLILAGVFSTFLLNIPRSGIWLMRLRKVSGFILIIIGEYFLIKAGRAMW